MSNKRYDAFERNDDFWDIDEMLPKKKVGAFFSSDTNTAEVEVSSSPTIEKGEQIPKLSPEASDRLRIAREALKKAEEKHLSYMSSAFGDRGAKNTSSEEVPSPSDEPLFSYSPKNNPLISDVTVKLWPAKYSFYEQFRRDAIRLFKEDGSKCPPVSFFSFTPQYSQLTPEQLDFYLYFRRCVREGSYIKADYSYVLLLVYEIINLPDVLPPENGLSMLVYLWQTYRLTYPKLDRHLSEWVCDYCLINRIDPTSIDSAIVSEATPCCSLKEFYIGLDASSSSPYASALFAYASVYNYKNSKYITEANRDFFDKHIKAAFIYAFTKVEREHHTIFAPVGQKSMIPLKTVRDAYNGALCAYNVKRRIEVSYLSCSRSVELRYAVTDAVKFAENQVRAILGIRSRFHTPNLAIPLKNAIEEYFAPLKKAHKKESEKVEIPEYDVLYEPAVSELSLSYAKDIEERSWATTELLTDGIEDYDETQKVESAPVYEPEMKEEAPASPEHDLWLKEALELAISQNKQGFTDLAHSRGLLPDALCEAVNDKMYDVIGDIVLENDGDGYTVVVDYLEEIKEWMKK